MGGNYFRRYEKKYQLNAFQYYELSESLKGLAETDEYGFSDIYSLYFDTEDYRIMRRCIDAKGYKEKLRLRAYGLPGPEGWVYLELKKKLQGLTYKRRLPLRYGELAAYLDERCAQQQYGQIDNEIDWFIRTHRPGPRFQVAYKRLALRGIEDPEFRVTFDSHIRCCPSGLDFAGSNTVPMIGAGEYIMEIKCIAAIPGCLSRQLSALRIFPVSFSKSVRAYGLLCGKPPVFDECLYAAPMMA
ncbi:MAG: polyphosphate polymerase domain-containing protein [Treponema sp.]|jgi:hypothetical protein|nr:polyphosphate polymerase domain-containing protein [Treponema sp.]